MDVSFEEKYNSTATIIPRSKIRFRIFPKPMYLKKRKQTIVNELKNPLLVFFKTKAESMNKERKAINKKSATAKGKDGSVK